MRDYTNRYPFTLAIPRDAALCAAPHGQWERAGEADEETGASDLVVKFKSRTQFAWALICSAAAGAQVGEAALAEAWRVVG
jgi:hypothetical protein